MSRVGELLSMHLDGSLTDHFSAFDAPGRTTLLHQWHDARLCDGTEVTVKLVRPEARVLIDTELELLPILEELDLDSWERGAPLIEDFVVWLDRQLDLGQEVLGLDRLAAEVGAFDAFEVPTILHELCCRDVTVTHRTGGTPLGELPPPPTTTAQSSPAVCARAGCSSRCSKAPAPRDRLRTISSR